MSAHHLIASTLFLNTSLSLSLYNLLLHSSPFPVCWARGARPQGKLLYGQTWLETPDPVRSPKLSNHGRVQYSGGGPPGKRTYCTVSITTMSPNTLRSARAQERVWTWLGDTATPRQDTWRMWAGSGSASRAGSIPARPIKSNSNNRNTQVPPPQL